MVRPVVLALLVVLSIAAPLAARGDRSVTTVVSSKEFDLPYRVRCVGQPTIRDGNDAVASAVCRTLVGFERDWAIMTATVKYEQSGEVIGECDDQYRVRRAGRFVLSCRVAVPPPAATLPIVLSGAGDEVTAPVLVPGGTIEATAVLSGPNADEYFDFEAYYEDGDWEGVVYGSGPQRTALWTNNETRRVRFEADVPDGASWTLTLSDAFPD